MKNYLLKIFVGLGAVLMIFGLAETSNAQRREARGRMLSKAQVKAIIDRVETRLDNFVENYDRALDRSRLDGSRREDVLMQKARALENATDELEREFDRRDAWRDNRDEVRRCLNLASDINRNMNNRRYGRAAEANWARVRFELNTLADVYNLPKVGAGAYR